MKKVPLPSPMKPLPALTTVFFQPDRVDEYCHALADLLCWMDGFRSAGGTYSPGSLEKIRDLSCNLKSIQSEQSK